MKVAAIEVVQSKAPVDLPEPWRPAWKEPDTAPVTSQGFGFFRVHTDDGITGIGPAGPDHNSLLAAARASADLIGREPSEIGRFFDVHMRGRDSTHGVPSLSGIEIALWDILGKAAGQPVYKLLGACRNRVPAYAATAQLHSPARAAELALEIEAAGFRAIKLRLHRPDPADDVRVVKAVREAVGSDMTIMVDANQNHTSWSYENWSRRTARLVARQLDELDVFWLEEPLQRSDLEGLSELRRLVDVNIAGGEHANNVAEFQRALAVGAYDILQPDLVIGNVGIIGMRETAVLARAAGVDISPHVCSGGTFGILLAATLQALGTIGNCPYVEYPYDPPSISVRTQQGLIEEPILIDEDGCVPIPQAPGIGVTIDEGFVKEYA